MGGVFLSKSYGQLVRHRENQSLFTAVELSILAAESSTPLHLHAEGLRGTGKTTILRAARQICGEIVRVSGCLYNCAPEAPHCPEHRHMGQQSLKSLGVEVIPMPFLEISHGAKVATVVGSIDLARLTRQEGPQAALLPGTLAQAHRGVVLVDEINRLVDTNPEIADVLLDVMGTKPGRLQIEEVGLPKVELPLTVTVWAASNPDEDPGPLDSIRRQLADRFDLSVGVKAPSDAQALSQILMLSQRLPGSMLGEGLPIAEERKLWRREPFTKTDGIVIPSAAIELVAKLYIERNIESVRAAEAILIAARMHCAYRGGHGVEKVDIVAGLTLALRHRVRPEVLADIVAEMNSIPLTLAKEQQKALSNVAEQAASPPNFMARLRDVFKSANPHSPGGPHVSQSSAPYHGAYRHVDIPGRVGPVHAGSGLGSVAPPLAARQLVEIPGVEQVKSQGDLLP